MNVIEIYAVLLGGYFLDTPKHVLSRDVSLWKIIVKYVSNPALRSQSRAFFDEIDYLIGGARLDQLAVAFRKHLQSECTLGDRIEFIYRVRFHKQKLAKPRSFIGVLIKEISMRYSLLELEEAVLVWREAYQGFVSHFRSYDYECHHHGVHRAKLLLGKAATLPKYIEPKPGINSGFNTNGFSMAVAKDLELMNFLSHRNCDIASDQESMRNDELCLSDLSFSFASQGYLQSSLKALYQAFICDRLDLMREMRKEQGQVKENEEEDSRELSKIRSYQWNRSMVMWLAALMSFYGRINGSKTDPATDPFKSVPPALNYPISTLASYLTRSAESDSDRENSSIWQFEHIPDLPMSTTTAFENLACINEMFFNFSRLRNNEHWIQYSRVAAKTWWTFGIHDVARNYANSAIKACYESNEDTKQSDMLRYGQIDTLCDLLIHQGVFCGQLIESLWAIYRLRIEKIDEWTDSAQQAYSLLFGIALLRCHDLESSELVIDQLYDCTLPKTHLDALRYIEIQQCLYHGEFHNGFVKAQKYAKLYSAQNMCFLELFFLTKSARCLVLSQDTLYLEQAEIIIKRTMEKCMKEERLGLVFELVLLSARLVYNEGQFRVCHKICTLVKSLVPIVTDRDLRCEWSLLICVSSVATFQHFSMESTVTLDDFVNSLYTEFDNQIGHVSITFGSPSPQVYETRPLIIGPLVPEITPENNDLAFFISDVFGDLTRPVRYWGDFTYNITHSYKVLSHEMHLKPVPASDYMKHSTPIARRGPPSNQSSPDSFFNPKRFRETNGSPTRTPVKRRTTIFDMYR